MKHLFVLFCFLITSIYASGQSGHAVVPRHQQITTGLDPEKVTIQLINTIPAASRNKADSYTDGGHWLILWNIVCEAFVAWLFLFGGISPYIKRLANKTANKNTSNLIYIVLYIFINLLIMLPFDLYQNFIRERQYGFSNQDLVQWLSGELITIFIEAIILAPIFMLIYAVFRRVKENWWAWGGAISIIIIVGAVIIYPVFIGPALNKYTPLKDGALKDQLLSMARANQANIDRVYVYNESLQTTQFNANVSGFAGTARISLNDNMLNNCTNSEIKAVLAHETAHYVLNSPFVLAAEFGLLTLIGFRLVKWVFDKLIRRWGAKWQISGIQDVTSLPLLVFLLMFYFFVITPVSNTVIRTGEVQADLYGLNAAREPDGLVSFIVKSADYNKIAPGYWEEIIFFDHPCRKTRILTAMKWKAENSWDF